MTTSTIVSGARRSSSILSSGKDRELPDLMPGFAPANVLSPELRGTAQAQGSNAVENPRAGIGFYGYLPAPERRVASSLSRIDGRV